MNSPPRLRGVHWWTSVALILLGLLVLLAIAVQSFSGQLLMEDRYWEDLTRAISDDHAERVRSGHEDALPSEGLVRSWYLREGVVPSGLPRQLAHLPPGIYTSEASLFGDAVNLDSGETYHAVVAGLPHGRLVTVVNIEPLEQQQNHYARLSLLWILCFAAVIGGFIVWLHANLVRPVRDLAARMQAIDPSDASARLPTDYPREEIQVIAQASNAHLERVAQFIQRERSLLDQASHEFRTPIAVIAGAADVLRQLPLPAASQPALARIEYAVEDLSETMVALLYLAREAGPGVEDAEITALHDFLPRLVLDHEYLLRGKDAQLRLGALEPTFVAAPEAMVRIAVSNLIRNAIENTDVGFVEIVLSQGRVAVIDSGSGFDPVEAARRYRDSLRQPAPMRGQGLGLFLIGRICERFRWTLGIDSGTRGTRATLDVSASVVEVP
ncbi:HAMP domain-containing histidine kinase [Stenotrophomonas maltophilia]|uniref:sensor histidine kinase n=1 Tax=Stenotrophomonas maltophilia TaxID=40324 RepID=UPI0006BC2567|nr:HAMP domain-containing sensor histidine kinase [Stenotrophomonas maltophilia]ALA82609.1 hypothetical protein VN11_11295 [Stenotrophomonas maltophilia]MBH1501546.1 HAMP domain-containing histidine kinase [Stenotrophomonas maltophilia]MBH1784693.1 HAMP domain-containing histidine kinase [Stenotrophomonas maltophilia]